MDWSNDDCPVSNEPAREALPRIGDFAEMICPTCGRFRISRSSLETIRHYEADDRLAFLEKAKREAQGGAIPFIMGVE
jgi:hypothetical protein